MLNLLDRLSDISVKCSRDIITIFIFGLLCIGVFFGNIHILNDTFMTNQILILSIANYILSYMFSYFIIKKIYINLKIRFLLPIAAAFFSFISIIFFMNSLTLGLKVGVLILNLILWIKGMKAVSYDDDYNGIKNRFVLSIIVLLLLIMINFFMGNTALIQKISKVYLPIYLIIYVLYFTHSSLLNAYRGRNVNTINMTRNIRKFSIISTFITISILLLIVTDFFGAGDLKIVSSAISFTLKTIEEILKIVLYPVVFLISKIVQFASKKLAKYSSIFEKNAKKFGDGLDSRYNQLNFVENPMIVLILDFVKWAVFVAIVLLILIYIFKKIKNVIPYEVEEIEEGEEKDFVLSTKDIRHMFKKRIKNFINKMVNSKTSDLSSLHAIRRMYIEVIWRLSKKGYQFRKYNTPNEYLSSIKDYRYTDVGFDKLTKYYNDVRYGRKQIKGFSIAECKTIKDSIEKIK